MASQILLPKNVDLSKITFGTAKTLNGGARVVPVSYEGKQFIFQTARMTCNYGMSKWGEGPTAKYSLDGSFKGKDENKSLQSFYEFLMKLDKFMVEKGVENSVEWLKKKHSNTEVVAALYSHAVRFPKDKDTGEITDKYPPSYKCNLPVKDGKVTCSVYDQTQALIDLMALGPTGTKGATISAIIKCTGVWLAGGNYGLTFRIEQLRIEPTQNSLAGFAFQDEDDAVCVEDDDEDDIDIGAVTTNNTHIDTSDDEDDVVPTTEENQQPAPSEPTPPTTNEPSPTEEDDGIDPPTKGKTTKRTTKK